MHAWRRSGSPAAPTPEALFGPVDLPGDTAVMLIAFGSIDAFGSIGGDKTGISPEAFPTLDAASKTPPGPVRSFGGGPVGVGEITDPAGFAGDGEVTDPAGFAGGGEFTDPAGFAGGVLGAATLGDPTELFPVVPFRAPAGGVFTGGLLTGPKGLLRGLFQWLFQWASASLWVVVLMAVVMVLGSEAVVEAWIVVVVVSSLVVDGWEDGGRPLGPMATAAPDFPSLVSPVVMGVSQE
eukprot:s3941_g12.t1